MLILAALLERAVELDLADLAAQRRLRELRDREGIVRDAVRRARGIHHLQIQHAVDADLHVVLRDADLLGDVDRGSPSGRGLYAMRSMNGTRMWKPAWSVLLYLPSRSTMKALCCGTTIAVLNSTTNADGGDDEREQEICPDPLLFFSGLVVG